MVQSESLTSVEADPAFRRERARKAARARTSLDYYVAQVVEAAGELTPAHLERLRALLPPAEVEG